MRDFEEVDEKTSSARRSIVRPYTEEERVPLQGGPPRRQRFATMLIVRTGRATMPRTQQTQIHAMKQGDSIDNPYADIEWDGVDILPPWVVDSWQDDGIAMSAGGELAHGTTKVLLGNTVDHSTAITGDPFYDVESEYTKVAGLGNQFWVDLSHWDVRVHTVRPWREGRPGKFLAARHSGEWMLDKADGRPQSGAIPQRTKVTRTERKADLDSPNAWQGVLDLGVFGRAIVLYSHSEETLGVESKASDGLWASYRGGLVGMVYNLEMHGLYGETLKPIRAALMQMGLPVYATGQDKRLSVIFFPPRIKVSVDGHTIERAGIHQTSARDRIKWNGKDLPLTGDRGIFAAVRDALPTQAPGLLALMKEESSLGTRTDVDVRDMPTLVERFDHYIKAAEKSRKDTGEVVPLIADPVGKADGEPAEPHGSPGSAVRPDVECEHGCTGKFHAEDCPNRRTGGGGGGGGGRDEKLDGTAGGRQRGRRASRARAKSKSESTDTDSSTTAAESAPPKPPSVTVQSQEEYSGSSASPAFWGPASPLLEIVDGDPEHADSMQTGQIFVNRDHASYKALEGYALDAVKGRDRDAMRVYIEEWIKVRVAETLLAYLALKDQELAAGSGAKSKDELREALLADDDTRLTSGLFWLSAFSSMFSSRHSLKSHLAAKTAADAAA